MEEGKFAIDSLERIITSPTKSDTKSDDKIKHNKSIVSQNGKILKT